MGRRGDMQWVFVQGTGSRFTVQHMLVNQNAIFLPRHDISSMKAISSGHNFVKEPICTLPRQSLDQLRCKWL